MLFIMFLIAGAFIFQLALGYFQIKHFTKVFVEMRRIGKVAIGRRPGKFRSGTIVLFALSDNGTILKAKKMQGVTVFAKACDLHGFTDKNIKTLKEKDINHCNSLLKSAILDATINYKVVMSGEEIPEKQSFLKRMIT